MTMPHLMNCLHSDSGWCIDCVKEMYDSLEKLRDQYDSMMIIWCAANEYAAGRTSLANFIRVVKQDAPAEFKIKRTGKVYSISSSEFKVSYPDGIEGVIWSPPWHDMSPEDEVLSAMQYAVHLYVKGEHSNEPHA